MGFVNVSDLPASLVLNLVSYGVLEGHRRRKGFSPPGVAQSLGSQAPPVPCVVFPGLSSCGIRPPPGFGDRLPPPLLNSGNCGISGIPIAWDRALTPITAPTSCLRPGDPRPTLEVRQTWAEGSCFWLCPATCSPGRHLMSPRAHRGRCDDRGLDCSVDRPLRYPRLPASLT